MYSLFLKFSEFIEFEILYSIETKQKNKQGLFLFSA